jgi:hypothetical protein
MAQGALAQDLAIASAREMTNEGETNSKKQIPCGNDKRE